MIRADHITDAAALAARRAFTGVPDLEWRPGDARIRRDWKRAIAAAQESMQPSDGGLR